MLNFPNHIPHALLISGGGDSTLQILMPELKGLLCEQGKVSCGACPSCHLFESESGHPDLMLLQPEGKIGIIKIDSVRAVISFLEQSSLRGGLRIVVLAHADALNIASQNALLKSLEEPGAHTLIVLLSEKAHLLLPTIKSRCQFIAFPQSIRADLNTLAEAFVLPFDILVLVQKLKEVPLQDCFLTQMYILYDALRIRMNHARGGDLTFPDLHLQIESLTKRKSTHALFKIYQVITAKVPLLQKQVAINGELFLYQNLIEWSHTFL